MTDTAITQEAQERREGQRTISLQVEEVRADVASVKAEVATVKAAVATVQHDVKVIRRRARRDVSTLTEELAKLNRRVLAIALAAVLAAFGSIPEARAVVLALVRSVVH